jgi:hypothetical protein
MGGREGGRKEKEKKTDILRNKHTYANTVLEASHI